MIFDIATTVESLSQGIDARAQARSSAPATPSGGRLRTRPAVLLETRDKVEADIESIGVLQVEIARPSKEEY
jgi:2-keto-4-pentenoate hydratase/2-oxohepta-3-ene-1,7-dioic acid hydratase in catechol pathway